MGSSPPAPLPTVPPGGGKPPSLAGTRISARSTRICTDSSSSAGRKDSHAHPPPPHTPGRTGARRLRLLGKRLAYEHAGTEPSPRDRHHAQQPECPLYRLPLPHVPDQ